MERSSDPEKRSSSQFDLNWSNLYLMGLLNLEKNAETAIMLFQRALASAESEFGEESAQAGMCLVELNDLYLREGNYQGAEQAEERIRAILQHYARRLGVEPDSEKIYSKS